MINVIKKGNLNKKDRIIYQDECPLCGCVFEFEKDDVKKNWYGYTSIECPCCKNRYGIQLEGLQKKGMEVEGSRLTPLPVKCHPKGIFEGCGYYEDDE